MEAKSLSPNLMVKNVQETVDFYQDLLNVTVVSSVPSDKGDELLQWAMVQTGGVTLMFQEETNLKAEYPTLKTQSVGGGLTLYLTVTDVEGFYERAKKVATIIREPHKTFYGATEFAVQDNNGYILTFSEAGQ
ncbi:VOC family protein [Spirosoma arcticum]